MRKVAVEKLGENFSTKNRREWNPALIIECFSPLFSPRPITHLSIFSALSAGVEFYPTFSHHVSERALFWTEFTMELTEHNL